MQDLNLKNVDPRAVDDPSVLDWYRQQARDHAW